MSNGEAMIGRVSKGADGYSKETGGLGYCLQSCMAALG